MPGPMVIGGPSVAAVAMPGGIAYAAIAHVPPVVGLYSASLPVFACALFGSSPRPITGPDAATGILAAASAVPP